jgi:bla regulator protein blaR1
MQTLLFEFVIRTSLIAAAIALVLYGMRLRTASLRHAVWTGVIATMLLLPAWLVWGPKASLPVFPPAPSSPAIAISVAAPPIAAPVPMQPIAAQPRPSSWNGASLLFAVYVLGAFVLLLRLAVGTIRAKQLTNSSCVVPVTVGFFRPRIILPQGSSDWPQARLDAVLIHECEHARRRDPLFQWIALLNRALFWFHPLAWWLERQLSGLAEEACDDTVLSHGFDPHDYSESLLDLARSVELAGARIRALSISGVMHMPGAFLPQRIRRMLSAAPAPRVSRPHLACTLAACAAVAVLLAAGTLVRAQSKSQPKAGPTFEVASIRKIDPNGGGGGFKSKDGNASGPGPAVEHLRFAWSGTLFGFILQAYAIQGCGVMNHDPGRCTQLSGGPAWVNDDRFQIQATMPEGTPDYTLPQFTSGRAPQLQLMLQALLADRFQLKLRREKKTLPVYALTAAKGAAKLTPSASAGESAVMFSNGTFVPGKPFEESNTVKWNVKSTSMQELAGVLANILGRPIVDRTNLKGKFDFTMQYERDAEPPDSPVALAALGGAGLLKAFESQVGVKLESTKAPVDVLIIDHAEHPTDN